MPWVRTEDRARCHPKFFRAGFAAFGWWNAALGYCNEHLTNGFIPIRDLELVFPGAVPAHREQAIEALVREGLLHVVSTGQVPTCRGPYCRRFKAREGGYLMHDFLVYQPSKTHVENVRRVRSTVARKGGVKSGETRKQIASTGAKQTNELSGPIQSDPSQSVPKDLTALSGSTPDGPSLNGHGKYREQARDILAFLNAKTGRTYRAVDTNLRLIEARLKAGATVEDCRGVIARKARAWVTDPKMSEYLRPATLFNATKFEQYLGEQG